MGLTGLHMLLVSLTLSISSRVGVAILFPFSFPSLEEKKVGLEGTPVTPILGIPSGDDSFLKGGNARSRGDRTQGRNGKQVRAREVAYEAEKNHSCLYASFKKWIRTD